MRFRAFAGVCLLVAVLPASAEAFVRSVEYVEIVLGTSQTSGSANLSKGQTVANSVPFASAMADAGANGFGNATVDVFFATSPPRVMVQRGLTGGAVTVGVFVVEFDPTYVKVQQGTFAMAGGNAGPVTQGITAVSSLTRAALVFYTRNNFASGNNGYDDVMVEGRFNSTSQIAFERNASTPTINGNWYVFEALNVSGSFAFVVDAKAFTFTGVSGSSTLTPAVTATQSFVVGSYRTANTNDHGDLGAFRLFLSGCAATCTSVNAESEAGTASVNVTAYVLTFPGGVAVQRGFLSYNASGGNSLQRTATLGTPVSIPKSMVWNGFGGVTGIMRSADNSGDENFNSHQKLILANATTVQGNRGATVGTARGSWEVIEWGPATTAVTLSSFDAQGLDGAVELSWRTASELENLGFHLHRSESEDGPYERITSSLIPGLGSSPEGARYAHRDDGRENGVTYYYKLEDVESTGRRELHGPVAAMPRAGAGGGTTPADAPSLITYGEPSEVSFRVLERTSNRMVLELRTNGFFAAPAPDGAVRLSVPGFSVAPDAAVPTWRAWLDVPEGEVRIASVRDEGVDTVSYDGVAGSFSEVEGAANGAVRLRTRRSRLARSSSFSSASILSVGYQGEARKALVELSPLRWDAERGELALARVVTVTLTFARAPSAEARVRRHRARGTLARFETRERGLYRVSFQDALRSRSAIPASELRLSRLGEAVAFHVEPNRASFGPGSTLYFWSEGGSLNPYDSYAAYELEHAEGLRMPLAPGAPKGSRTSMYWQRVEREENRYYQPGLFQAPDPWLWDLLFAPAHRSFAFDVSQLAPASDPARLEVALQGASDFGASPDHHLRFFLNGVLLDEGFLEGKSRAVVDLPIPPGVLREGPNELSIENVGDTGADYSMVMLDRFAVVYPRLTGTEDPIIDGTFSESGVAHLSGPRFVLDATGEVPRWLGRTNRVPVEAGHRYLAVDEKALRTPTLVATGPVGLGSPTHQADYLVIGPREFLEAAEPLLELRRSQGLTSRAVAVEDIYSEFGCGESRPEAIRDFLSHAYHDWRSPAPRYVLLLGDGTYDFADYLGTGVSNRVPPLMVKTSFLTTASDPAYASVRGDDPFPDLAIGRLPAANLSEARTMVAKILAYERSGSVSEGPVVLVADNPDDAGDFVAHAEELAAGLLAPRTPETIYLHQLGVEGTRQAIGRSFDRGAALLSYIGHGGIHLWASENVLETANVSALATTEKLPIVATLNCLNGYFHFPYFDSLGEALVKAEGKGAVAAITPSGLSLDAEAHVFHLALVEALVSGRHRRLGDAMFAAQQAYASTGHFPELLSIYHLLGDPALTLR